MSVANYVRVSTEDQSLKRQLHATIEYAEDLGVDRSAIETFRDKSTGTDTNRQEFTELLERAEEFDAIVVHSVSRIARSIRDFEDTVDRVVDDAGTELHIISEGFELIPGENDPYQKAMLQMLAVFAELEAEMAQNRTREGLRTRMQNDEYHHGPAPLGFEKNDGRLIEGANYDHVVVILQEVVSNNLSKRKAASELDCARVTINRALERAELYGIEAESTAS
ncbi:recombinase family protein [Natronomonas sp. LN261]|uniref:recombinase family protein n=1 Tax=Natronomonas sp. LN261 TaxID=2750669 RepID=UPI0015EF0CE4